MGKSGRTFSRFSTWTHLASIFALLATLMVAGCGDDSNDTPQLSVEPSAVSIVKGRTATVVATVNGATAGADVIWSSANLSVATVVEGVNGSATITAMSAGTAVITVALRNSKATVAVTVTDAVVESIAVTPPTPSLAAGTDVSLTATATLSDKTTSNVTSMVMWTSSDTAKATINAAGKLHGVAKGTTTVRATLGAISGMATATITDATLSSIAVTPAATSLAKGLTRQMTATGTFSDGSTQNLTASVTWTSSAPARATVSAAGLATAVSVGSANVIATLGAVSGQTTLEVTAAVLQSIAITPVDPSLAKGLTLSLTATGTYSDSTTADLSGTATWMSSNTAVATTNGRVVTAVAVGNAVISATSGGITGTTNLTVTAAALITLQVTPADVSLAKGRTQQLTATGIFTDGSNQNLTTTVTWSSSDITRVSVSNADGSRGLATAIGLGAATVSATQAGITGSTTVTVTAAELVSIAVAPASFTLAIGRTQQLTATGTYTDNSTLDLTTQATWTSSNTTAATVSNAAGSNGLVTAVAAGNATLTATLSGISGSSAATITGATLMSIAVTPLTASISVGSTQQYTAIGTYSDTTTQNLTTQVTWASTDATIAEISNAAGSNGLATARAPGDVTISATLDGVTGTATLTAVAVTLQSIVVTPANASIAAGRTQQMTATGTYSNNSTQDLTTQVTWMSSDTASATISNVDGSRGLATGVAAGTPTISATLGGVTGSTTLTVTPPVIVSIAVTPATANLDVGMTQAYVATATFSDTTTQVVTTTATWDSTDKTVATVSNEAGTQGVVTAVGGGTSTITATQAGVTGNASVTVRALVSIAITTAGDLARGTSRQLVATGTYNDASTADVTELATWTSSDPAALTVNDAAGRKGLATGVTTAGATVTATVGSVAGTLAIAGCSIVINEVQVAGAGTGNAANEWVELASKCTSTQNLAGLRLAYRSAAGVTDVLMLDLTGTIAAGGYNFYVHVFFAGSYPTANGTFGSGNTGTMSGTAGGVGLRIGAAGAVVDSMGYGATTTNAFVEGMPATVPPGGSSSSRIPDKTDTNANSADFAVRATPTPGAANI